ncbi:MAG TPA: hypothetical protein VJ874_02955 [Candidatus Thermoplasmatota archaeon]|nr:hypothetical protein [Candidatus Thermoplasmatota archaeon]
MRSPLLVVVLLLAGCSAGPPGMEAPLAPTLPAEVLTTHQVAGRLLSPLSICPPAVGACAGVFGSDTVTFGGQTWVALDVTVVPSEEFPPDKVLGPLSSIRVVALCLGERLTCPQGQLATAEGPFPLRLMGEGFRIADPDQLALRVEYLGPLPLDGSGASYELSGGLTSSDAAPSEPAG